MSGLTQSDHCPQQHSTATLGGPTLRVFSQACYRSPARTSVGSTATMSRPISYLYRNPPEWGTHQAMLLWAKTENSSSETQAEMQQGPSKGWRPALSEEQDSPYLPSHGN